MVPRPAGHRRRAGCVPQPDRHPISRPGAGGAGLRSDRRPRRHDGAAARSRDRWQGARGAHLARPAGDRPGVRAGGARHRDRAGYLQPGDRHALSGSDVGRALVRAADRARDRPATRPQRPGPGHRRRAAERSRTGERHRAWCRTGGERHALLRGAGPTGPDRGAGARTERLFDHHPAPPGAAGGRGAGGPAAPDHRLVRDPRGEGDGPARFRLPPAARLLRQSRPSRG